VTQYRTAFPMGRYPSICFALSFWDTATYFCVWTIMCPWSVFHSDQ